MKTTDLEYVKFLQQRACTERIQAEMWLSVRSCIVHMVFYGIAPTKIMLMNLAYLTIEPQESADETVYIWEDSLHALVDASIIPKEQRLFYYYQTEEYRILFPGKTRRFAARFTELNTTFVCFEHGEVFPEPYINKPFVNELQWWVMDHYLLLHGAVVGVRGKGALITAPSGYGKSTLTLAGLLDGMDYIAEDYVLVNRKGPATGYPIFTTAFLTPNTLEMLPELKKKILLYDPRRNKYLIDLAAFENQFSDHLSLDIMLFPKLTDSEEITIRKATSVKPFMDAVTTTAKQIKTCGKFADSFKLIFERMKTIPSYQLLLTKDPEKNARMLREFLENYGETK